MLSPLILADVLYGTNSSNVGEEIALSIERAYMEQYPITIPDALEILHYKFHASDTSGLWNQTIQVNISVSDNDAPTAEVGDNVEIYQGNNVKFNSSGSHDNIGIVNYTWSFSYDGVEISLYDMNGCPSTKSS